MKGVLYSINRNIDIVDISHDLDSYDIKSAAFLINQEYKYYPKNTIHLVVIDPGVGSERKPLLVCSNNQYFIGPDNGVFSYILKSSNDTEIYEINNNKYFLNEVSSTFHGRDIFAPVASHLSLGIKPGEIGEIYNSPVNLDIEDCIESGNTIKGRFIYSDKFGNLITNIPSALVKNNAEIIVGNIIIQGISNSFSSVKEDELLAIKGSSGYIEISVNMGSAKEKIYDDYIKIRN